ncbi:MAG: hypothetical protein HLUCCA08_03195 [Rhodobacteraceae bacterium HLUCCA08]|nr:MAG: hypothetical protein HLUCCA08_03195 [Rhodobacteraceae bacterium HLUCCA08]
MIDETDLKAGVASGILSEGQAAALASLAHSRSGARKELAPGDEPFELFRGFNEIFIVIGLIILASGWYGVTTVMFAGSNYFDAAGMIALISGFVLWLLSEYFIRRRRMVAPAILLSILFALNATFGFFAIFAQPFMVAQEDFSSLSLPFLVATLTLLAYWFRFRVPFAMALIATGAFATALVFASTVNGSPSDPSELFLLSAGGPFAWITLALGVIVFLVAMWFDMSDPHRVTRRSAQGFWLHIVAAPALVNTLALTLLEGQAYLLLFVVLLVFALVAIVIDRRSFLIAGIGYSVILATIVSEGRSVPFIILALGIILVLLGAFWERIRARVLGLFPFLPLDRLPPSHSGKIA